MDCMGNVIGRMRIALANNTKSMKAFNSDFHEHGVTVVHDWYANIIKSCQRTTRMVCEEYSRDLLATYKKCFQEFPHIHPTAFIEALHEEIFPLDQDSNENKVPSQKRVDHLLRGVTDKGLIAMFATTRKHAEDVDVQNSSSRKESQRMAAGASILFLRIRRWLMAAVDSQLLDKFEVERMEGLDEIKQSCKTDVEQFCDMTDVYYDNHITNALRLPYRNESDERKQGLQDLHNLGHLVIDYRQEAEEIMGKCGLEHSVGYDTVISKTK
eukprot:XP_011670935.1 PREDICTED: uncharacterized protein LOC105441497 [Strongylocentrotus purpuratus]